MRFRTALVALATMRITDLSKEASPLIPPPWAKSLFAGALACGLTVLTERDWRRVLVEGAAAAGMASLMHDLQWATQMYADTHQQAILMRRTR